MSYIEINEPFYTEYPTFVIGFCPDTDSFFVTNQRHWYWQSEDEFESEESAIEFFENHIDYFTSIEQKLMDQIFFYGFRKIDRIFLENTEKWYLIEAGVKNDKIRR